MNGVLNFSVLDGWWYEGYKEGAGWALTDKRTYENQQYQDQLDAATIYHTLETQIIPTYYAKNSKGYSPEWIQYIKNSMSEIAPDYTMKRMLDDYISRFYDKLATRSAHLRENDFAEAKSLAAWKEEVVEHWDSFQVESFTSSQDLSIDGPVVGKEYTFNLVIDRHELQGMLRCEQFLCAVEPGDEFALEIVKDSGRDMALGDVPTNRDVITAGIFVNVSSAPTEVVRSRCKEACPELDFPSPVPFFLDVVPAGWSKVNGLDALLGSLGVTLDEVAFIGDSENDVTLLEKVPNSYAVAGAMPEAKAAAHHLIGDAAEDSVAKLIEQIVQQRG